MRNRHGSHADEVGQMISDHGTNHRMMSTMMDGEDTLYFLPTEGLYGEVVIVMAAMDDRLGI